MKSMRPPIREDGLRRNWPQCSSNRLSNREKTATMTVTKLPQMYSLGPPANTSGSLITLGFGGRSQAAWPFVASEQGPPFPIGFNLPMTPFRPPVGFGIRSCETSKL
jgi:hypothetical protein